VAAGARPATGEPTVPYRSWAGGGDRELGALATYLRNGAERAEKLPGSGHEAAL
jgi:hypothetical protein